MAKSAFYSFYYDRDAWRINTGTSGMSQLVHASIKVNLVMWVDKDYQC
ncbi:hypothetical protein ACFOE1_03675 [Agromyces mediolanus]|uniref:Uncharacterized protein n=1 Tax=Agromyces mediolanus TaxID=41986 RepID=A0A918CMM2_AGRME|nr:hypothetical protein [Agromyces mediolanus]GGR31021.1 hypothetical protein GCM10010196_26460 [Agromyces mediolanus]GLJ72442.1 hypothetical protein GCM10017583_16980 [Agromyces mediolanus]